MRLVLEFLGKETLPAGLTSLELLVLLLPLGEGLLEKEFNTEGSRAERHTHTPKVLMTS